MAIRRPVAFGAGVLATGVLGALSAISFAAPETRGTEVILDVKRVVGSPGRESSTPQYMCLATLQRANGQVLAQPKIQVLQGVPATVSTTTDSGSKVMLRVEVSSASRVSYEIDVTSPEVAREHHRATIGLPEQGNQ